MNLRKLLSARSAFSAALVVACMVSLHSTAHAQRLTVSANPPSGVAGVDSSYLTGSGFSAGAITGAVVHFGTSCAGPAVDSATVFQVGVQGVLRRFGFAIPATLASGTYQVWVTGTAGTTAFNTLDTPSCSVITVGASNPTLAACVPTSSLAIQAGTNVTAFIPRGAWLGLNTGIAVVPLEGSGTASNIATVNDVNSCAANSVTGEVVCTENNTVVDLISPTLVHTTVNSSSNTFANFSGGSCQNCGVGINAANNTAVIAMGLTGPSNNGLQVLNLATGTFNTPFPLNKRVSEDISIDSGRNYILSPGEDGNYDILKIGAGNSLTEFTRNLTSVISSALDSAAEDCTTGIAMTSSEGTSDIFITDLTQAVFTAGTPGTWTAPGQKQTLNGSFSAGTCGMSSAPGSGHLAVVTGEFGGSSYAALQLPSTSGSGTPALVDYAYVSAMPNTPAPNSHAFTAGFDPHTVTAYTSPIDSKSYSVFVDYNGIDALDYAAVVDLQCVLALPRTAGTHTVVGDGHECTRFVAIP